MSNLYTRVRYDQDMLSLFDKQNKDANILLLDKTVKENNNACYAPAGSRNAASQIVRPMDGTALNLGQKADIENRVMNRHKELNNDFGRTNRDFQENLGNVPATCQMNENLTNEDSRFTNPVVNYREIYTAPYNFTPYLFVSPQEVVSSNNSHMTPNRYGESSRYSAKTAKYDLKPKQFATLEKPVNFVQLHSGLLPVKGTANQSAVPYVQ